MKYTDYYYCDCCGKPIDHPNSLESRALNICPECAARLYKKIFGNQEGEQK